MHVPTTQRRVKLEYIFVYDHRNDPTINHALRSRQLLMTDDNKKELMDITKRPTAFYFRYTLFNGTTPVGGDSVIVSNTSSWLLKAMEHDQEEPRNTPQLYVNPYVP